MHVSWRANSARSRSDRGASFGLGAIVGQVSAEAFGEQLGRIVPRLFRYRFDPSAKTRSAMEQLWRSVVGGGSDFSSRENEVCLYSVMDIRAPKGSDERSNNEAPYIPQHRLLALNWHRAAVSVDLSRGRLRTSSFRLFPDYSRPPSAPTPTSSLRTQSTIFVVCFSCLGKPSPCAPLNHASADPHEPAGDNC